MASIDSDPVFQQGLESILAPLRANGASQDELDNVTAQARSFYLSQQLQSVPQVQSDAPSSAQDAVVSTDLPPADETSTTTATTASGGAEQPPYPSSFASLAALIASGQPIPGIKEIPDKLAEGEPSESTIDVSQQGKKPWERSTTQSASEVSTSVGQQA